MKKYLVTGGAGFIGSNFIHHLFETYGDDVTVYNVDSLTYAGNLNNLSKIKDNPNYQFIKCDITSNELEYAFSSNTFDAVIHFAAESHVDRSIMGSKDFVVTNVLGTERLLELSLKSNIKKFVHISTDEVYGSLDSKGKFTEETPLAPNSPYSASKASADLMVRAYGETHNLNTVIVRCSNNYGPYQFPEKLIPLMITNAMQDKELRVYGQGDNIRDWIHVSDFCSAVSLLTEKGEPGEVYNVGGNAEKTNLDVVKTILQELGKSESLITFVKDRPGHDYRYAMDYSKINQAFGWEPKMNFEDGLKATVNWYQDNRQWWEDVKSGAYVHYYEKQYG